MASLKKLASIPSLTQLYRKGIVSPSAQPDLPAGNQSLNEKICTIQYDITKLEVDAIVNAANKRLLGGGGVDGAIHRAAGPGLYRECKTLGGCDTGSAKITDAYNLPCKKVIHAVGPIYYDREESEPLLRGCYKTALELAARNDCKSIAFSAISTGIYGYPSDEAAEAALDEVRTFLHKSEDGDKIDKVIFVNFMQKDVDAYSETLPKVFPAVDESAETATDVSVQDTVDSAAEDKAAEGKESSEKTSKAREDATSKEESAKAAAQNTPTQPTSTSIQENLQAEMAIDSTDVPSQLLQLKDEDVSSSIDIGKLSIESRPTKQEYTSVKPSGLDETGKLETELEGLMETDESAPNLQPADKVDESSVGVQRP